MTALAVRLTRQLTLETLERLGDGAGGFVETWQPLGTLWAEIAARAGRETAGTAAALSTVPYLITVRATPYGSQSRPVAGQRFREGTRIFSILAVADDDPAGKYLSCFAEEEVAT